MTISIITNVVCDYCTGTIANWFYGMDSCIALARPARQLAHEADWKTRRSDSGELLDICPQCQEREQERENDRGNRAEEEVHRD